MPLGNQTAPCNPTTRAKGKLILQCWLIQNITNYLHIVDLLKVSFYFLPL